MSSSVGSEGSVGNSMQLTAMTNLTKESTEINFDTHKLLSKNHAVIRYEQNVSFGASFQELMIENLNLVFRLLIFLKQ